MYCTEWPPIVVGSKANVLRSGIPSEAAGPVADNVTPTLMSCADTAVANTPAASAHAVNVSMDFMLAPSQDIWFGQIGQRRGNSEARHQNEIMARRQLPSVPHVSARFDRRPG